MPRRFHNVCMLHALEAPILSAHPTIRHGFFTRDGGVSGGVYGGLNCGLGSADAADDVIENRRRVAAHLGASGGHVVTLYQEHGTTARTVTGAIPREHLPKADAVVTKAKGLAIGVLTADCGPVLFADPDVGVVAAAHAGWRGALAGILPSTIVEMERLGAKRQRIVAAVGPCIGQAAYEVSLDFEAAFLLKDLMNARYFIIPPGSTKPHFDLAAFIVDELTGLGLAAVESRAVCTHSNESQFFSYRRSTQRNEPDYGRQISAIVVA